MIENAFLCMADYVLSNYAGCQDIILINVATIRQLLEVGTYRGDKVQMGYGKEGRV
jgi:hypothetical protein